MVAVVAQSDGGHLLRALHAGCTPPVQLHAYVEFPLPMWYITYVPSGARATVGLCANGGITTSFGIYGPVGWLATACLIKLFVVHVVMPQPLDISATYLHHGVTKELKIQATADE